MVPVFLSSGDLIADRRAFYAQSLHDSGEHEAAADLMDQALEFAPGWAAGWVMAGRFHEAAGALERAISAWRRAAALDPAGGLGAQVLLAAHGAGVVPPAVQATYVEALFDSYASDFDEALLSRLGYAVPGALAGLIAERTAGRFARALDLGCGTGLMGERLRGQVGCLEGVDLSRAMLEEAAEKGIYDSLRRGDLGAVLAEQERVFDLVTAADVFIYCEDLSVIFQSVADVLHPEGIFAFSTEIHEGEGERRLQSSLRFAHAPEAILLALTGAGFGLIERRDMILRRDRGEPVRGSLFLARRLEHADFDAVTAA